MAKPIGAICNLDCTYCYYLHKEKGYAPADDYRMNESVLREYIRQSIDHQPGPEIHFSWQGGEPTLLGVDYFENIVKLQRQYIQPGKVVVNDIQTNGTLLDEKWCEFFRINSFLVGISIDGPPDLHDYYRKSKSGAPTSARVVAGIRHLQKYQVEFNTLTVLNRMNAKEPMRVYEYLTGELGSNFLQFIPCVEPVGFDDPSEMWKADRPDIPVTDWTVLPEDYGDFLITIFDHWVRNDVGRVFVRIFDTMLGLWMGMPSSSCNFGAICGKALALEHDGSVYCCDHYVYPEYKLGNLRKTGLGTMVMSKQQMDFAFNKEDSLPQYCKDCEVKFACNGDCPKNRILYTPDGEPGLNYLCAGNRKFMNYIDPYMKFMAKELQQGRNVLGVMDWARRR